MSDTGEALSVPLSLKISEIFFSLQGEGTRMGVPTVFVRLTGCPLRCVWCDTSYAFSGGVPRTISEIIAALRDYPTREICVTGGEPLAQRNCFPFLEALCNAGFSVSLETSGALDITAVDPRVARIVDVKAPGSQEEDKNYWVNLDHLRATDELKFVLADRADYEWAKDILIQYALVGRCTLLFSPVYNQLNPTVLAEWILEDGLPVRLQIQLHKWLWGNTPGK